MLARPPAIALLVLGFLCAPQPSVANPLPAPSGEPKTPSEQKSGNDQTDPPKDDKEGGDPVILSTGNFHHVETDLAIQGRGMGFTFMRTYRSGAATESALGAKWDHNWNRRIVLEFVGGYVPSIAPGGGNPLGGHGPGPVKERYGRQQLGQRQSAQGGGGSGPQRSTSGSVPLVGAFYYDGALRIDLLRDGAGDFGTPDVTSPSSGPSVD